MSAPYGIQCKNPRDAWPCRRLFFFRMKEYIVFPPPRRRGPPPTCAGVALRILIIFTAARAILYAGFHRIFYAIASAVMRIFLPSGSV